MKKLQSDFSQLLRNIFLDALWLIQKLKFNGRNSKCYKISYLINWSKHWHSMSQALCEQRDGPPPPTKASEGGVIVQPAITKDPELLMVAAMIDPSWKFTMVENEFQRTVKIAE